MEHSLNINSAEHIFRQWSLICVITAQEILPWKEDSIMSLLRREGILTYFRNIFSNKDENKRHFLFITDVARKFN